MDISFGNDRIILANIHLFLAQRGGQELIQLREFFEAIASFRNRHIIIGGDFNLCLEPIDSVAQSPSAQAAWDRCAKKATQMVQMYIEDWFLSDTWRLFNPDGRRYTHRGRTSSGRLDFFLLSQELTLRCSSSKINLAYRSDHSSVQFCLSQQDQTEFSQHRLWKFPNWITDHEKSNEFKENIKKATKQVIEENAGTPAPLLWQTMKGKFRQVTGQFCKANKSNRAYNTIHIETIEKYLETSVQKKDKIAPDICEQLENTILNLEVELQNRHGKVTQDIVSEKIANFYEKTETVSKYFLAFGRKFPESTLSQL